MEDSETSHLKYLDSTSGMKIKEIKGESCIDEDFPPNKTSLYNEVNSKLSDEELELWKQFVWKRPHQIFQDDFTLYNQGIDPEDIKQGWLGNCYFLSALSALAEFPDEIKKIFVNKSVNENGIYIVNFTLGGESYKVVVDDHFPYYPKKGKPAFSQSKGSELWVMLLEKVNFQFSVISINFPSLHDEV